MQKVDLEASFIKCNENCGLPDLFTDYQIRHLGNPSGLPKILLKIDPCVSSSKHCYLQTIRLLLVTVLRQGPFSQKGTNNGEDILKI